MTRSVVPEHEADLSPTQDHTRQSPPIALVHGKEAETCREAERNRAAEPEGRCNRPRDQPQAGPGSLHHHLGGAGGSKEHMEAGKDDGSVENKTETAALSLEEKTGGGESQWEVSNSLVVLDVYHVQPRGQGGYHHNGDQAEEKHVKHGHSAAEHKRVKTSR